MKKIVLAGNPNVGKSVIFSQLTGARVVISNYSGTTVDFAQGYLKTKTCGECEVIDAPGTYSLEPISRVEEVASSLVESAVLVINVVDATNLERNLFLTTQLLGKNTSVIIALNMIDEAKHQGINLNLNKLQSLLGVPVIPTVAVSGEGIKELVDALPRAIRGEPKALSPSQRWARVGEIVRQVQKITHRQHTWLERLQDASLKPLTGIPLAALVVLISFGVVIGIGDFLHEFIEDYIFEVLYEPVVLALSRWMEGSGIWHDVLIGYSANGHIDFEEAMGVLTTGVFVALGVVLPFLVAFYLVLGFLEDSGYLPRLAVMVDRGMHRLGLHGYAIIPMVLGFGCNVPAAMAVRNLESRRERFIASTLMAIAIPCMAQLAIIVGLVGRHGIDYLSVVFAALFFIWIVLGLIIDRAMPGYTPSMVVEIPPYRIPSFKAQVKKLSMRVKAFLVHALPYILGGVLLINLLHVLGIINFMSALLAPSMVALLGLPGEAVSTLLIGFLRKDVAVAMLAPLGLTSPQLVVGAIVLATYFPCAATFTVLVKELGIKDMFISVLIMVFTAFSLGFLVNMLLSTAIPPVFLTAGFVLISLTLLSIFGNISDRRELKELQAHRV